MASLELKNSIAYFRDSFVPFSDANLSIASSPVLYGLSIYTVFSLNWNAEQGKLYIFRLRDHYNRLVASAKIMDFNSFEKQWNYDRFEKMVHELIAHNKVQEDALVRVSVFVDALAAGTKIHNLKNSLSAYVYPMGEILPLSGINVCISSWRRVADDSIPPRAKVNGGYANVALMKNEALVNGFDDAIALNQKGNVSEATVANLFLVAKNVAGKFELITPSTDSDILEGITRNSIIQIAKDMGIQTREVLLPEKDLYTALEAFVCGSSARITPVLSIGKAAANKGEVYHINGGKIGELTSRLMKKYSDIQKGNSPEYAEWRQEV